MSELVEQKKSPKRIPRSNRSRRASSIETSSAPASQPVNLPLPDASVDGSTLPAPPKFKHLPNDSVVRIKVHQIIAMQLQGYSKQEISKELEISEGSISTYLYLAGKHGWLETYDPKDRLEYSLGHKVVRNLDKALDSEDDKVALGTALEVAKGTLFKKWDSAPAANANMNVLSIRIEMPTGSPESMREGTAGGTPEIYEGELLNE